MGTEDKERYTEHDGVGRFHHVTQNGAQFETYESFISGIFHLIFSGVLNRLYKKRKGKLYPKTGHEGTDRE
jgi:hypothetical protein